MAEMSSTTHYHPLDKVTATWQEFVADLREHATRTADERADREEDRKRRTLARETEVQH